MEPISQIRVISFCDFYKPHEGQNMIISGYSEIYFFTIVVQLVAIVTCDVSLLAKYVAHNPFLVSIIPF